MTELAAQKAIWTRLSLSLSVRIACCKERQSKARKKKPDQKIWAGEVLGLWLAVVVGSANSEQRAESRVAGVARYVYGPDGPIAAKPYRSWLLDLGRD